MSANKIVNMDDLEILSFEVCNSYEYLKDYGHASSYLKEDNEVKALWDESYKNLKIATDNLHKICSIARDNFEN